MYARIVHAYMFVMSCMVSEDPSAYCARAACVLLGSTSGMQWKTPDARQRSKAREPKSRDREFLWRRGRRLPSYQLWTLDGLGRPRVRMYAQLYGPYLQNIFMHTGCWLTVIMAAGRYAAICRPLQVSDVTRYFRFRPHRMRGIDAVYCYRRNGVVRLSAMRWLQLVSLAKNGWTGWRRRIGVDSRNYTVRQEKRNQFSFACICFSTWQKLVNFFRIY